MDLLWIIATTAVATLCFVVGVHYASLPLMALALINAYLLGMLVYDFQKNPRR